MPTKTIITTVTLGIHDPEQDSPEVKNHDGTLLMPATKGTKYVLPGEPVTLDAAEANKILLRYGGEEVEDPEVTLAKAQAAVEAAQAAAAKAAQDAAAAAAAKAPPAPAPAPAAPAAPGAKAKS